MSQLAFPWAVKVQVELKLVKRLQRIDGSQILSNPGACEQIFRETFREYELFMELPAGNAEILHFVTDVESCIKRLLVLPGDFARVRRDILSNPRSHKTIRHALATQFLFQGLWPVKAYFGR